MAKPFKHQLIASIKLPIYYYTEIFTCFWLRSSL